MITEDYVSFETARLLKKKGFNEPCNIVYSILRDYQKETLEKEAVNDDLKVWEFLCPTLQRVMKWLREKHSIHIEIETIKPYGQDVLLRSAVPLEGVKYHASIVHIDKWNEDLKEFKWKGIPSRDSYEEACEAAIRYTLENLI